MTRKYNGTAKLIAAVVLILSLMGVSAKGWQAMNREVGEVTRDVVALRGTVADVKVRAACEEAKVSALEKEAAAVAPALVAIDNRLEAIEKRLGRIEDRLVADKARR